MAKSSRALRYLDLPDRAEPGIQGRLPPMGALAAGQPLRCYMSSFWFGTFLLPATRGSYNTPTHEMDLYSWRK